MLYLSAWYSSSFAWFSLRKWSWLYEVATLYANMEHVCLSLATSLVRESIASKIHGYEHGYPWFLDVSLQLSIQVWISTLISKQGYPCKDILQWKTVNKVYQWADIHVLSHQRVPGRQGTINLWKPSAVPLKTLLDLHSSLHSWAYIIIHEKTAKILLMDWTDFKTWKKKVYTFVHFYLRLYISLHRNIEIFKPLTNICQKLHSYAVIRAILH